MKIELMKKITFKELEEKIREIPLMQLDADGKKILVYKNSRITLRSITPEEVNPPTFYLLQKQMQLQRDLRQSLIKNYGIDSLTLNEAIEIKNENGEIWTLTPPIIEVTRRTITYVKQPGEINHEAKKVTINIPLICDGSHRAALARELDIPFNTVYISQVSQEHPYYAHPNGWEQVKILDEIPKTMGEKKLYRHENSYALYRDFSALGCGKPRFTSN